MTAQTAEGPLAGTGAGRVLAPIGTVASWIALALIVLMPVAMFLVDSPITVGFLVITMMVAMILMGVPVAAALAVPSLFGVGAIASPAALFNVASAVPGEAVSNWGLSVLPMFIYMGMLLTYSGITRDIYHAADVWFRWLPGGIGIGTNVAGAGLAAVSGSSIGMTYTLGRSGIPEMLKAGYDKRLAIGTVIVAGLPGALIPPSILLLLYAGIASTDVGPQLMAGVLPGILVAVTFAVVIFLVGLVAPRMVGRGRGEPVVKATWGERFGALLRVWPLPVIMVIIIGGMFSGLLTPTEAGAAAALLSLLLCLWRTRKDKPLAVLGRASAATVAATGSVMFLIIGADFLTRILQLTGISALIARTIVDWGLGPVQFLAVMFVVYLIMGMFFDTLSMMLLTVPVLLPALTALGVDPIWFGVFVVLMGEIGMVTPPLGVITFVLHKIVQDPKVNLGQTMTLRDVFVPVLWFLPVVVLILAIMALFPQIALWLPSLM
ncbi:TRAP transporter large permease [Micrococcus endophyticus]|uniref:TRAP transporter large permease n=1 Tax=Micrococcus endophyticus TaxID=455343 RepID=UPI0034CE687B